MQNAAFSFLPSPQSLLAGFLWRQSMQRQFEGNSVREAVRKAIAGYANSTDDQWPNAPSTKRIAEALAPPLVWGNWYRLKEFWTPKDRELHLRATFKTIRDTTSFDIEFAHGVRKTVIARALGPGSTTMTLPRNIVTAVYARCRAHSGPAAIDIRI